MLNVLNLQFRKLNDNSGPEKTTTPQ